MRKGAKAKPGKASRARNAAGGSQRPSRRAGAKSAAAASGESRPAARATAASDTATHLVLGATCTLREAAALHSQLLATTTGDATVTIDGSAVQRIDASGLQLLAALAQHEAGAGRRLEWQAASPELLDAAGRLGLTGILELDELAGGAE
jgi:ABC-type transporter Mla MlaB component